MPTPVTAMRTQSVETGPEKAITCCPWWAMPWAWATSGAFPTSPTRMEEVPVLRGRVGWAHLAVPRREEGRLQWPALNWACSVKAGCGTEIEPAHGRGICVLFGYQLRREIVFGLNCKFLPENSSTLLIYSQPACAFLSMCQYPLLV